MDPFADFMAITGCEDENVAAHYLSENNFDASVAASIYMADRGRHPLSADDVRRQANNQTASSAPQPSTDYAMFDVENEADASAMLPSEPPTITTREAPETIPSVLPTNAVNTSTLASSGGDANRLPPNSLNTLLSNFNNLNSVLPSLWQGATNANIDPVAAATSTANETSNVNSNPMINVDTLTSTTPAFGEMGFINPFMTSDHSYRSAFQNTFERSGNTRLAQLFSTPSYVHQCANSITEMCELAAKHDNWLVLVIRDNEFDSNCLTRDVWNSNDFNCIQRDFVFAEIAIHIGGGQQIAQGFRVPLNKLPIMFIIDPITMHQEMQVNLPRSPRNVYNAAEIANSITEFLLTHGSPHDYLERRHAESSSWENTEPEYVNVDDEFTNVEETPQFAEVAVTDEMTSNGQELVEHKESCQEQSQPQQVLEKTNHQDDSNRGEEEHKEEEEEEEEEEEILAISLDEWSADDSNPQRTFKLRCRLPRSTEQLSLKPETPLSVLRDYLWYCIRRDDKDKASSQGSASVHNVTVSQLVLLAGVPPRELNVSDWDNVTLETCPGLRSGDVVIANVKKN